MDEKKIVRIILDTLNMKVKVMFNTPIAHRDGPYFGLYPLPASFGPIMPHIGLPIGIFKGLHSCTVNQAKKMIKSCGVRPNKRNITAFVILHELGHYDTYQKSDIQGHEFFYRLIPDKEKYRNCSEAKMRHYMANPGKAQADYARIPNEKLAFDFAKLHIKKVSDALDAAGL